MGGTQRQGAGASMGRTEASDPAMAETVPSEDGLSSQGSGGSRREALDEQLCGQQLHHFRVDAVIGRGGMGTVYRAHDLSLDRPVALKVVSADVVEDTTTKERFVREARAQARLSHPNVVQIHYIGEQDDLSFFAMELVEGESLDDVLARGELLEWQRSLEVMIDVALALNLAHQHGIIHRDIKPSNLLIGRTGPVKVADFGLAKWVKEDAKITQVGRVLGTPLYMSPEQAQGETTDHRSDIYSLGATLYHLIAGHPPFTAETPMGIVVKQITQPLPSIRLSVKDLPNDLVAVIERMMAKAPESRFQSYDELIAALVATRPQTSPPAGLVVRAMALLVDIVLIAIFLSILVPILGWFLIFPYILYQVLGWWRRGQTVGKWLFRIQVRSKDNTPAPLGSCVLRAVFCNVGLWMMLAISVVGGVVSGNFNPGDLPPQTPMKELADLVSVSALLLTAAFWGVAIFRRDRRALYDLMSGTAVFYRLEK